LYLCSGIDAFNGTERKRKFRWSVDKPIASKFWPPRVFGVAFLCPQKGPPLHFLQERATTADHIDKTVTFMKNPYHFWQGLTARRQSLMKKSTKFII